MEDPPKKFFRLSVGKEVLLKHAYYVKCTDFIKDNKGQIIQVNCTYDPLTKENLAGTIVYWSMANRKLAQDIKRENIKPPSPPPITPPDNKPPPEDGYKTDDFWDEDDF